MPDWPEMNLMLDYLHPGDIFVDVGANVGVYSLLASVVPDVEVWAFEPSLETWRSARANVTLNDLDNSIHVVRAAVGADEGTVMLTVGLGSVNHVVPSSDKAAGESVPMVALDSHLLAKDRTKIRVLKIDVEGDELAVLDGARGLIRDSRPLIIVEANDIAGLATWLSELEYRPFTYMPERRELSETTWEASPTGNIIALADTALAWHRRLRVGELGDPSN